jgi:Ni/Co efflux regulator RcnB
MRKFLIVLAAVSMLATPAAAQRQADSEVSMHNNRFDRYEQADRHKQVDRHDRKKKKKVGKFLTAFFVGAITGVAISGPDRSTYRSRRTCFETVRVEERFGRRYKYYEYKCR